MAKSDGIERVYSFDGAGHSFPQGVGRRRAVVKTDTELGEICSKESHPALIYGAMLEAGDGGIVVNSDGRLAGSVGSAGTRWSRIVYIAWRNSGRWRRRGRNSLQRDSADETLAERIPWLNHDAICSRNGGDDDGRRFASGRVTGD